MSMNNPIFEL